MTTHPREMMNGQIGNYFCECGKCLDSMSDANIEKHKQTAKHHRWLNWGEHLEQQRLKKLDAEKKRVEQNKEKIYESHRKHNRQRIVCECGCEVRKGDFAEHKKTQKHLRLIATKQNPTQNM